MDDEEYDRLCSLVQVAEAQADEEEANEAEYEEEEVEELEDMPSPRISLSCWLGTDGKTHHGVMVVDDTSNHNNRPQFDDCSICYDPFTSYGKHRICCLPCGHMYGLSCIKKWLLQSSSGDGKCPQCNGLCAYKDIVLLFPSCHRVPARQKASSTRHFPFTEEGADEFAQYELSRWVDANKLLSDDQKKMDAVLNKHLDACNRKTGLSRQWHDLFTQYDKFKQERDENLGQPADAWEIRANALGGRAYALKRQIDALGRRANAFGRRAEALRQRHGVLRRRADSYVPSLIFFSEMLKEHFKRMAQQKKNTKPHAAAPTCHTL